MSEGIVLWCSILLRLNVCRCTCVRASFGFTAVTFGLKEDRTHTYTAAAAEGRWGCSGTCPAAQFRRHLHLAYVTQQHAEAPELCRAFSGAAWTLISNFSGGNLPLINVQICFWFVFVFYVNCSWDSLSSMMNQPCSLLNIITKQAVSVHGSHSQNINRSGAGWVYPSLPPKK